MYFLPVTGTGSPMAWQGWFLVTALPGLQTNALQCPFTSLVLVLSLPFLCEPTSLTTLELYPKDLRLAYSVMKSCPTLCSKTGSSVNHAHWVHDAHLTHYQDLILKSNQSKGGLGHNYTLRGTAPVHNVFPLSDIRWLDRTYSHLTPSKKNLTKWWPTHPMRKPDA